VRLPLDGSKPQPILLVLDGFQCQECAYKTRNRKAVREHANKQHNKKRVKDEYVFRAVRLQSWFGEKRERYWVVDESRSNDEAEATVSGTARDSGSGSGSESGRRSESENEIRDKDAVIKGKVAE
jgi:hypothetical protein